MDPKLKITVLKAFRPEEMFPEPPVEVPKGFGPCDIHDAGQEFTVEREASRPEGFCCVWLRPSTVLKVFLGFCSLGRVVKGDASSPSNQKIILLNPPARESGGRL
jgi:uncharacterized repeat protein (TIGR04076 family)